MRGQWRHALVCSLRSCACKKRARTRGVSHGLRRFSQAPRLHLLCLENECSCRGSRVSLQDLFYKTLTWDGEKYNGLVYECFWYDWNEVCIIVTSPYEEKDVVIDLVNNAEIFPMEKGYKTSSSDAVGTSSAELDESELQGFTLACCSVLRHQWLGRSSTQDFSVALLDYLSNPEHLVPHSTCTLHQSQ